MNCFAELHGLGSHFLEFRNFLSNKPKLEMSKNQQKPVPSNEKPVEPPRRRCVPTGLRANACVVKEKLWSDRQVLRVYFTNPEVLEGWKCEGKKKLTTDMIMEWAGAFQQAPSAPQFEVTTNIRRADIRVEFSSKL